MHLMVYDALINSGMWLIENKALCERSGKRKSIRENLSGRLKGQRYFLDRLVDAVIM